MSKEMFAEIVAAIRQFEKDYGFEPLDLDSIDVISYYNWFLGR